MITRGRDLEIAQGRMGEANSSIAAADRRTLLLGKQLHRDALAELAEAEAVKSDRQEAMKKAEIRNSWQIIRAPVDGTIVGSQVFTIGDMIEPGALLMMIAPQNEDLIVEAMILNKDIGFVKEGDEVVVKLEAYPFTRYGLIEGELSMISADAMMDERFPEMLDIYLHREQTSTGLTHKGHESMEIISTFREYLRVKYGGGWKVIEATSIAIGFACEADKYPNGIRDEAFIKDLKAGVYGKLRLKGVKYCA